MSLAQIKPALAEVPLASIDVPARPSRATMDEDRMDELVHSIQTRGFCSAIVLAVTGERYEVIAGHRRTMAAKLCGLFAVPALVYPDKAVALESIKFAENRVREDLKVDEEAIWFSELLEGECDGDTDKLAALLGERRDYVEGRLLLLAGDAEVFAALGRGEISIGAAQELNRCGDERHRRYLLLQTVTCGATIGTVKQWVHEWRHLHSHVQPEGGADAGSSVPVAPIADDYFTCYVCELKENPQEMRPVQIHRYCQQAVLQPALEFFQRRRDYVEMPRTDAEAIALIQKLVERFPSLGEATTPAA